MKNNRYFYMEDIDCVVTVEYASRKELLELLDNHIECCKRHDEMVANGNPDAKFWYSSEEVFMILYKDGTTDYINGDYDGHKIRRQHIASIVECNSSTYMVYGNFEMIETGSVYPAFEDAIDESLKEVDSEDYTESAPEQTEEQETAEIETVQVTESEPKAESGTIIDKSDWDGKIARLKAVVSYFKSHNMHWEANKAYKNNWKFYREHTAEECIKIIHEECTQETGIQV